jgi:hypothetical protein
VVRRAEEAQPNVRLGGKPLDHGLSEAAPRPRLKHSRITIEHPGAYRDVGDLINTRVVSTEPA